MKARLKEEGGPLLFLLAAAILFFWKSTLAGNVLLPVDNLYQFQPWASYAPAGFSGPHNALISDSILENYGWKRFLLESIHQRQLPLWDPNILGGTLFLAPGQASVLYPFVILWLILPLAYAYGWFAAVHLFFAGASAYGFLRLSGGSRIAGLVAGLTYMFSARLVTSILWPQMMGAIVYLPLLLLLIELTVRQARQRWPVLPVIAAALALGISILAGHIEASVYVMAAMGLYALARIVSEAIKRETIGRAIVSCGALALLGIGLAAVQLLPFYEVGSLNFRSGAVSYQDVAGFALKLPQLFTFLMPDFYGNPVIHSAPYWGPKDYVEQAAYLGVLPLLLAAATLSMLLGRLRRRYPNPNPNPQAGEGKFAQIAALWAVIAVSLLLAFGTPLYRVVFFLLPGFNQIHSPFRWLIPYTGAMALLSGFGFDFVRDRLETARLAFGAAALAAIAGLAVWLKLVLPHIPKDDRALEVRNYVLFLALAVLAGVICWTGRKAFALLAVALIALDLGYTGIDFNTAADPALLSRTPALIAFLQQDHSLFRVSAYAGDDMKANGNALYDGIQDARGYDSVIIGRYARLNELLEPQDQLVFNRIKPIDRPAALKSPLLNLLNVKYVLTPDPIQDPQFEQVYTGADGRVYRNRDVLPRAFVVPRVQVAASPEAQLEAVKSIADFSATAVVDRSVDIGQSPQGVAAQVTTYTGRKVAIQASGPGLLVLTDNNFPGWKATVDGQPTAVVTTDYTFRGVPLPPGQHTIEFNFAPTSLLVGGLVSALSLALILVACATYAWRAFARRSPALQTHAAGRVTKNSLTPMASNVAVKILGFAFSLFYFRALGVSQVGKYIIAGTTLLFLDTIIGFGLQQLVMRDVARDKASANAYISNALAVRLIVTVLIGAPVALGVLGLHRFAGFDADTALVIVILIAAFVPGAFSNVFSHIFDAHELMEYRAFVQVLTQIVSITLGVAFVLAGWDIVGLAAASFLANIFTAIVFWLLIRRVIVKPRPQLDGGLIRAIFKGAYPIMLNQLLVVFFFKIDVLILPVFRATAEVGLYGAAYKFVDAMLLVPSAFVPALFPILSRQAASERDALRRGTDLGLKVLLLISLPLVAGFEVFAGDITRGFFGDKFAGSAVALRILMLYLPFSYVNGLTQYVLIALDKQKAIVRFFAITAVFNVVANLALIPRFGYVAASAVTVGSEVVLLAPLWWLTARELGRASLGRIAARPALAALVSGAVMLGLRAATLPIAGPIAAPLLAACAGAVSYVLALLALHTFTDEELKLAKSVLGRRAPSLGAPEIQADGSA